MDWIKIPIDNILYSEFKNSELLALIKFQALYCQLEKQPTESQLKRVLNQREFKFVQSSYEVCLDLVQDQIKKVKQKRRKDKESYKQKQQVRSFSESGTLPNRKLSVEADKIREDKIREDIPPIVPQRDRVTNPINEGDKKYLEVARKLSEHVFQLNGKRMQNEDLARWCISLRKMEKEDGIPIAEQIKILQHATKHIDDNYLPFFESAAEFRKKYSKLMNHKRRNENAQCKQTTYETRDQRVARVNQEFRDNLKRGAMGHNEPTAREDHSGTDGAIIDGDYTDIDF